MSKKQKTGSTCLNVIGLIRKCRKEIAFGGGFSAGIDHLKMVIE